MTEDKKLKLSATAKVTPVPGEPMKIEFAPGCFDHLDVDSQEELDAIMAEIQDMLANITPEELEAMSTPVTDDTLAEMDPEERDALLRALEQSDSNERKNRLQ